MIETMQLVDTKGGVFQESNLYPGSPGKILEGAFCTIFKGISRFL